MEENQLNFWYFQFSLTCFLGLTAIAVSACVLQLIKEKAMAELGAHLQYLVSIPF